MLLRHSKSHLEQEKKREGGVKLGFAFLTRRPFQTGARRGHTGVAPTLLHLPTATDPRRGTIARESVLRLGSGGAAALICRSHWHRQHQSKRSSGGDEGKLNGRRTTSFGAMAWPSHLLLPPTTTSSSPKYEVSLGTRARAYRLCILYIFSFWIQDILGAGGR